MFQQANWGKARKQGPSSPDIPHSRMSYNEKARISPSFYNPMLYNPDTFLNQSLC